MDQAVQRLLTAAVLEEEIRITLPIADFGLQIADWKRRRTRIRNHQSAIRNKGVLWIRACGYNVLRCMVNGNGQSAWRTPE